MEERLSVIIDADIKQLQSALNKAKSTITQFTQQAEKGSTGMNVGFRKVTGIIEGLTNKAKGLQTALKNATSETRITALNKELHVTNSELARLKTLGVASGLNKATQSFDGLTKSVGNSNGVAIEFSRIIQDAPFGVIGIGNNIQQLTANFAQLKNSAGSTGAALKASFASIISPANLLVLGISAITAAFTAYQMWSQRSAKNTEQVKSEIERLEEATANYIKTLNGIQKARLTGEKDSRTELVSLRLLYNQTQDTTLSLEERKKAVDKLQEVYPNVFKNIKDETILNGLAKTSYDELTSSIIANAKAKAAEETLVENERNLLALQKERVSVNKTIEDSEARQEQLLKDQVYQVGQYKTLGKQLADSESNALEPSLKRRAELSKQINSLTSENLDLVKAIGDEQKKVTVELDPKKNTGKTPEIYDANELSEQARIDAEIYAVDFANQLKKSNEERLNIGAQELAKSMEDKAIVNIPIKIDFNEEQLSEEQEKVIAAISNMQEAIRNLAEDVNKTIETGLAGGITDLTGSITDAFMMGENVAHAAGKSLLGTFATVLGQLGKLFIATGVGLQAVKKSLTTLNPVAAIAAGVGLVALSAAFGAGVKSIGGGMGSGGSANTGASQSFGGGMAPTAGLSESYGFTNASAFNPASMDITLNARIGNDAIYLSNKSEENKRNRI